MRNIPGVGGVIGLDDKPPVPDDEQAVVTPIFSIGDEPSERG
jgi:hypothetical protein